MKDFFFRIELGISSWPGDEFFSDSTIASRDYKLTVENLKGSPTLAQYKEVREGAYLWEDIKDPKGAKVTSQLDRAWHHHRKMGIHSLIMALLWQWSGIYTFILSENKFLVKHSIVP